MADTPFAMRFADQCSEFDAVFLMMDHDPLMQPVFIAVTLLDGMPDLDEFEATQLRMMALVPRRRQRLARVPWSTALPYWVDTEPLPAVPPIVPAPGDGSIRALLDVLPDLIEAPFPPDGPPMQEWLYDGVDGGVALVMRAHHVVGDGGSFTNLAQALFGETAHLPPPPIPARRPVPSSRELFLRGWSSEAAKLGGLAVRGLRRAAHAVADPAWARERVTTKRRLFGELTGAKTGPLSPVMSGRSPGYRYDHLHFPVADLKAGARALGGSLNDGFLTAVSEAVRRYHADDGCSVPAITCGMAVNLRTDVNADEGGNVMSGVTIELPVSDTPLADRLALVHERARDQRFDEEKARLVQQLLPLGNRMPKKLVAKRAQQARAGVDIATSNVPGLDTEITLWGRKLKGILPFGLRAGAAANIVLSSMSGTAWLGINSDPAAITDPDRFCRHLRDSLEAVASAAN